MKSNPKREALRILRWEVKPSKCKLGSQSHLSQSGTLAAQPERRECPFVGPPNSVKVASGQEVLASSGALLANITSALWKLPPSLQTYLDTTLTQVAGVSDYFQTATGLSSTALFGTAGVVLLAGAVPTVLSLNSRNKANSPKGRKNMSRYGWSSHGEVSPYTSNLGTQDGVPAVTEEDYSYITSQDIERLKAEDDVLLIKHKGVTYPEHFPPYSISDGQLNVADVVQRVKITMQLSDRRAKKIKLLYKGQQLREPQRPVRAYGVKDNSEVMVVIPEAGQDSSEDSSEEVVVVGREEEQRAKSKKKRKPRKKGGRDDKSPRDSGSNVGLDVPAAEERRPSSSRGPSPAPSASPSPSGPIDKLNAIGSHFTTKLLPLCFQFSANPPTDPKKRADEHRRISETVMQQVILKLDEIDTGGDDAARARRKELVRQVQDVLKGIDEKVQG